MNWINRNSRGLRFVFLGLLLVAIIGPWGYDRINVPAQYPCQAPNIRLEGDFCGSPLSGLWIFTALVTSLAGFIGDGFTGTAINIDFRQLLFTIVYLLALILPILSTFLILRHEDRRRRQAFHMLAWGLAVGLWLYIGLLYIPSYYWRLWGLWLFIATATIALILEIVTLVARKNAPREFTT